jgi:hypothetical protein
MSDRVVLGLFMAVVVAASAAVVVPLEQDYARDPVEKARRGEVTGLHELSMLRSPHAARALELIRERSPSEVRVQSLVIRPVTVSATIVEPGTGREWDFDVDPGFHVAGGEPSDASSDYGVTFRSIDAGVIEPLVRAVLDRTGKPADDVEYVAAAMSSTGEPMQWLVYLRGGRIRDRVWRADADGSNLRRNGE